MEDPVSRVYWLGPNDCFNMAILSDTAKTPQKNVGNDDCVLVFSVTAF